MKKIKFITVLLILLFITVSVECSQQTKAFNFHLKDLGARSVSLSDYYGKTVVLNFWATWCPPCRHELPGFIEIQKEYKDKGLVILGISIDSAGINKIKSFVKKIGINYPVLISDQKTVSAYGGIRGIPTTFIINSKGYITAKHVGYLSKKDLENAIKPLLSD